MDRVAAALLEHEDSYVFMIREKPPFEGRLNFIGGRIEPDESPDEAIIREIREETGCEAHIEPAGSISIEYEGYGTIEHALYRARTNDPARTAAPDEGAIVLRISNEAIHDADLHELHRLVIELIRSGTAFTARAVVGTAPDHALRSFEAER